MADNIVLNSGSGGSTLATDDVTSVHFQKIKLDWGGDGASIPATGDATNGLDVDVTRLPALVAGTANIGDVDIASLPSTTNAGATAKTSDYDTGAGTDTVTMLGIALPASGGAVQGGTTTNPVVVNVNAALPVGDNNIGNVDVVTLPALVAGTANIGDVDVVTLPALVAGTANIGDVDIASFTAGAITEVQGDVAHDAVVSGNPVLNGAEARTTNPAAVGNGDVVRVQADKRGRLVVSPHVPRDLVVHNRITLAVTTETTLLAAGATGVFRDIVQLILSNESATEVRVDIRDSSAGTIRLSVDLAPDGGGAAIPFAVPFTQATAANVWTAQLSAAVSTVYLTAIAIENN